MDNLSKSIILWRGNTIDKSKISGYPPAKCMNLVAKPKNASVNLTWEDPDDISIDGGTSTVRWAKTIIVRKTGSYPTNEGDGTVVVTSTTKNQYKSTPYTDTGLTNGTTYYYAAFACSSDGSYNEEVVTATAIPVAYRTMAVQFEITKTPGYGTYLDDAADMPYGNTTDAVSQWQEFFGYRPCLFKNGQVVGYLNPNDYTKFENGTSADITSGNAGDVMVEFPRRGINIIKSGNVITVSMTDDPDAEGFSYNAHRRDSDQKNYFYVGAYMGTGKSLYGGLPTKETLRWHRKQCCDKGTGYMMLSFYQFLFLQCMYLLQYKGNLDSQSVHGMGYYRTNVLQTNGQYTYNSGMFYGSTSDNSKPIKIFGIENLWSSTPYFLDGYYVDTNLNILTTTNPQSSTSRDYYEIVGVGKIKGASYDSISDVLGTNETGFTPCNHSGGTSYYFCDLGAFNQLAVPVVCGYLSGARSIGIFSLSITTLYEFTSDEIEEYSILCYL